MIMIVSTTHGRCNVRAGLLMEVGIAYTYRIIDGQHTLWVRVEDADYATTVLMNAGISILS